MGMVEPSGVFNPEYDSNGHLLSCTTTFIVGAQDFAELFFIDYVAGFTYKITIKAYRNTLNDTNLHFDISNTVATYHMDASSGKITAYYSREGYLSNPDDTRELAVLPLQGKTLEYSNGVFGFGATGSKDGTVFTAQSNNNIITQNLDEKIGNVDYRISVMGSVSGSARSKITGWASSSESSDLTFGGLRNFQYIYPPYLSDSKITRPDGDDTNNYISNDGTTGASSSAINLVTASSIKITKKKVKVSYLWSPNGTKNKLNIIIYNDLIVNNTTYSNVNSPYEVEAPDIDGTSYNAQVKRYFDRNSPISNVERFDALSNKLDMYTYQLPTLTGISLNQSTFSAYDNGTKLAISLSGANNRKWTTIENNFRTGIWSSYKSKYYIDEESTSFSRTIGMDEIKVLAPDTKASNGKTTATIYVNRRNLGVSGGNPRKW